MTVLPLLARVSAGTCRGVSPMARPRCCNIGQMEALAAGGDTAARCLNQLGGAFDPKRIMAPGRYARIGHA